MSGANDYYIRSEMNRRLALLEDQIRGKADANPNLGPSGDISSITGQGQTADTTLSAVSPPTTPSVVQQIGTVTVTWGASPSDRLMPYEVQFATDLSFSDAVSKETTDLQYTWPEGDPTLTYYARVRARTVDGGISAWSEPLETSTGKAGWEDLTALAATNPVRTEDNRETGGSGTGTTITGGSFADFAETWITTKGGIVTVDAAVQSSYMGNTGDYFNMDIYRDSTVVFQSGNTEFPSDVSALIRGSFPGLGLPSAPAAGTYKYLVRVAATDVDPGPIGTYAVQLVVHKVSMVVTEYRQGIM